MAGEVDPEERVHLVLEALVLVGADHEDEDSWGEETAEILARVDEMHLLLRLVVLVQALGEPPPVGQEAYGPVEAIGCWALALQIHLVTCDEVSIFVEASDIHQVLQWALHRCDDIGEEKVSESHLAKRRNENVPQSLGKLDAPAEVKAVDGHEAECEEEDEEDDREVLNITVIELGRQLDHSDLPSQAREPHEGEDESHSVKLVVDKLVMLVNLEDERVVDIVSAEDLHREACPEQDEADDEGEVVRVDASVYLCPIGRRVLIGRTDAQEGEEGGHD